MAPDLGYLSMIGVHVNEVLGCGGGIEEKIPVPLKYSNQGVGVELVNM